MPSIFFRIVSGELPAYKVAEDGRHLAFLDITPLVEGPDRREAAGKQEDGQQPPEVAQAKGA